MLHTWVCTNRKNGVFIRNCKTSWWQSDKWAHIYKMFSDSWHLRPSMIYSHWLIHIYGIITDRISMFHWFGSSFSILIKIDFERNQSEKPFQQITKTFSINIDSEHASMVLSEFFFLVSKQMNMSKISKIELYFVMQWHQIWINIFNSAFSIHVCIYLFNRV